MEATRKRRRYLLPVLLTTAGLTGAGYAAVEYGGVDLPEVASAASESENLASLDAIERAWEEQATNAAEDVSTAPAAADPFLSQLDSLPAESEPLVARGQQPRGGAIEVQIADEIPSGNPLRGRYGVKPASEQQAIADRFGGERYGGRFDTEDYAAPRARTAGEPAPIRVDLGPEARIRPVAAEAALPTEPEPIAAVPSPPVGFAAEPEPLPIEPPAFPPAAEEAFREPPVAAVDSLPLVDVPIEAPVDPMTTVASPEPMTPVELPRVDPPVERLASRQSAAAFAPPTVTATQPEPSFVPTPEPVAQVTPIAPATNFGAAASSTPAAPRPGDPSLEGRQQPSLAVQKFAPESVQIGKPAKFVVKIRNDSPRAIADVVVNDHTPAGSQLVSTTPTAETMGDAIRWQVGTLGAGEQRTLEMEIVPIEEGEIGSVATVSFAAQASAKAVCTRPLLALRMTAPAQVLVGQEQRMQIEVRNPGTGDATNVVLIEDVPQNLRHEAGPTLEFEIGTLKAGETRQLELVMNAEAPGPVSNVLTARADGDLQVEQRVDFEVVAPGLSVAVDGPTRRFLQRPATYTVRVDNPGTAAARDIRLVTRLPRGMQFVKANNLGEYDASTHAVYWALAELPQGEGGEVSLTATPTTAGDMTIEAEGKAQSGLQHKVSHQVRIEGIAAVGFEVLDVEDPIDVGGKTQYEVRVNNTGTKEATGVRVRFVAPPGMRVLSANGPTQHAVDSQGVTFDPLPRLAPRGENLYRVQVQADQAGDQRMMVEVTTDELSQPIRKEEATRVFGNE